MSAAEFHRSCSGEDRFDSLLGISGDVHVTDIAERDGGVAARRLAVRKNGDGFEVVGAGELVDVGWRRRENIRRGGGKGLRG